MFTHNTDALASEHVRQMHISADQQRAARGCRDPRKTISDRTGWTLVSIGLRLASRSGDA